MLVYLQILMMIYKFILTTLGIVEFHFNWILNNISPIINMFWPNIILYIFSKEEQHSLCNNNKKKSVPTKKWSLMSCNPYYLYSLGNSYMLNSARNTWHNLQRFLTLFIYVYMHERKWEFCPDPDTRLVLWPKETIKVELKY